MTSQATLTGAVDVIVVEREDGTLHSSPFHVRFGKLKILKTKSKVVKLVINGAETDLKMGLAKSGEGYFEEENLIGDKDSDINSEEYRKAIIPWLIKLRF
jgi:phosphatidate phosphatase LPIN